ncbi:odorant receptor 63a-like [Odontomachus brunneus]|uniref:odorant receptor 63a-like n=1 Tax=Odontomachus brunneus TaxID=486640 RepID=UPI0013F1A169|nr:odorant receptor 63a-like [Odontomachus brunneus]
MNSIKKGDKQDYYDFCRKFLSMVGQWPYQRSRERILCMSVTVTWSISILAVQIAQFYACETTQCIYQTLSAYLIVCVAMVKLFTCYFNNRKIKYLIEQLHADWNIFDIQEEREIMRRYTMNGRWYSMVYALCIYSSTLTFGIAALLPRIMDVISPLNKSRPIILPYEAYYFVDEAKYFYYIFFHLEFGALVCLAGLIAHDCTFLIYVEHVCGLFAIVGFRFEHLLYKHNITDKSLSNPSNEIYVEKIAFTIQLHQRALHFATLIEKTFSQFLAIQIIITVIVMSSSLMQLSIALQDDTIAVIKYCLYIVVQLLHLLAFSYQGQKLINHSLETHAKIYNGSWYNIPVKSQKLLLFAMKKSTETISLSAGKIYIFCLENFTVVMKASVSYFTICHRKQYERVVITIYAYTA